MTQIIVPSRRVWTRQPQHPTGIDWSNPITRGLVVAWVPSGVFSSQGRLNPTASSGPGVLSPGQFGIGNTFGQTGFELPVSPVDTFKASDQTYLIIGEPSPNIQWNMCITTGSGSFRRWYGSFVIHIYPSSVCRLAESAQWTSSGIVVARVRSDKTGKSFIVDNVEKTNLSSDDASNYGNYRSQLFQGLNGDRTSVTYWANKTFLAVKFDRYLSDKEVKSLTDNPWQIFKPRTRRTIIETSTGTTYVINSIGSIIFSGSSTQLYDKVFTPTGSLNLLGTNNLVFSNGATTYVMIPSGSIEISGTGQYNKENLLIPQGSILYSGSSPQRRTNTLLPTGELTFSGNSNFGKVKVVSITGTILFNGTAQIYMPGMEVDTTSILLTGVGK